MLMVLGEVALGLVYLAALLAIVAALVYLSVLVLRERGWTVRAGRRMQSRAFMIIDQSARRSGGAQSRAR